MRWYKILSVLLIIWSIFEPFNFFVHWLSLSTNSGLTFSDFFSATAPYSLIWAAGTIGDSILMLILRSEMHVWDSPAIKTTRNLLIFSACFSALAILSGISLLQSWEVSSSSAFSDLGIFLNKLIIFLPTYFYLKKRFYKPSSEIQMSPETVIPVRLLGVTDQSQRDKIIAEYMGAIQNTYTGNLITTEKEWEIYLHGMPEPVPQPQEPLTSRPLPTETEAETKFCRFCGMLIKADSSFCEYVILVRNRKTRPAHPCTEVIK